MSYDLILRSDERYTEATDPRPVQQAIARVLEVDPNRQLHWQEGDDYVQFDLSQVSPEGDAARRPEFGDRVNCIQGHMPRGTYGVTWKVRERATRAALAAAAACGWRVFDPQRDELLDDFSHRWRTEVVPEAATVEQIQPSSDAKCLLFAFGALIVWDIESGKPIWQLDANHNVQEAIWLRHDRIAIRRTLDGNNVIQLCDIGKRPDRGFLATDWVHRCVRLSAHQLLLSNGAQVDLHSLQCERTFETDSGAVALSPDGKLVAFRSGIWDLHTGKPVTLFDDVASTINVAVAAFSPTEDLLATGGHDKRIMLWDTHRGSPLCEIRRCGRISDLAFSPNGMLLASTSDSPTIRLWDPATGKPTGSLKAPGDFTIWDDYTGKRLPQARESGRRTTSLCFVDDRRLVTTHRDGRVCFWSLDATDFFWAPWGFCKTVLGSSSHKTPLITQKAFPS